MGWVNMSLWAIVMGYELVNGPLRAQSTWPAWPAEQSTAGIIIIIIIIRTFPNVKPRCDYLWRKKTIIFKSCGHKSCETSSHFLHRGNRGSLDKRCGGVTADSLAPPLAPRCLCGRDAGSPGAEGTPGRVYECPSSSFHERMSHPPVLPGLLNSNTHTHTLTHTLV